MTQKTRIRKGLKFKTDGVIYQVSKISGTKITCVMPDQLFCFSDTGGKVPCLPQRITITKKRLANYLEKYGRTVCES